MSEASAFRTVRHGYDPVEVDITIAQLREALIEARSQADDRGAEVTRLQAVVAQLRRDLALRALHESPAAVGRGATESASRESGDETEPETPPGRDAGNLTEADIAHSVGDDVVESAMATQDEDLARGGST